MQLDRKKLDRLLTMNDEQLAHVIQTVAAEAGIDASALGLNPENVATLRQALSGASDADIDQLNDVYRSYRKNRRSP